MVPHEQIIGTAAVNSLCPVRQYDIWEYVNSTFIIEWMPQTMLGFQ